MSKSTGIAGSELFQDDCTEGWNAPKESLGGEAQLIIDLGCTTLIDTIELRNLNTKQGTREFSLYVGQTEEGEWTELYSGNLDVDTLDVFNFKMITCSKKKSQGCTRGPIEIHFQNMQRPHRTGKYLKMEIISVYGNSGGLQFLSVNGKKAPERRWMKN